jgi:hypothetical protein
MAAVIYGCCGNRTLLDVDEIALTETGLLAKEAI